MSSRVPSTRWPVAGGRWPVAGGRWPVAGPAVCRYQPRSARGISSARGTAPGGGLRPSLPPRFPCRGRGRGRGGVGGWVRGARLARPRGCDRSGGERTNRGKKRRGERRYTGRLFCMHRPRECRVEPPASAGPAVCRHQPRSARGINSAPGGPPSPRRGARAVELIGPSPRRQVPWYAGINPALREVSTPRLEVPLPALWSQGVVEPGRCGVDRSPSPRWQRRLRSSPVSFVCVGVHSVVELICPSPRWQRRLRSSPVSFVCVGVHSVVELICPSPRWQVSWYVGINPALREVSAPRPRPCAPWPVRPGPSFSVRELAIIFWSVFWKRVLVPPRRSPGRGGPWQAARV